METSAYGKINWLTLFIGSSGGGRANEASDYGQNIWLILY